jgi:hypothetical protein
MGTLVTKKNGVVKNYLLNLENKEEVVMEVVSDILNNQHPDSWEIVKGFRI